MKSLRVVGAREEGLGQPTIMDRTLAQKYGVPYVHLAVFSIDVDRVKDALGEEDDSLPMGWEIFVVEHYVLSCFDPNDDSHNALLEDACLAILDEAPGEQKLGAQLPFAIYDAIRRGAWPDKILPAFRQWKKKPDKMLRELEPLFALEKASAARFSRLCLETALEPPPAPPTRDAWGRMVADARTHE